MARSDREPMMQALPSGEYVPPDGRKLSDRVADEIQRRILQGELRPTERLPTEAELCDAFGVSRSVIRDAIQTLTARGLVDVRQGHGMLVSGAIDSAFGEATLLLLMRSDLTMADVISGRAAIEIELAGLAAERGTAQDWSDMAQHLESVRTAAEQGDWTAGRNAHLAFHLSLLSAIHLPAVAILLRPMQQVIMVSSIQPEDDPDPWDLPSHYEVLRALESGDRERARDAMRRHFRFMEREPYLKMFAAPFREARGAWAALKEPLGGSEQEGRAVAAGGPRR
jgi:GntR family transcriptional regulator, transcriptional repressor for pyruvate dehydrogenase complex